MRNAVIIDAVRTAIGRSHAEKGAFRNVRGDDLAVACVAALLKRTGIDPHLVEDVVIGSTQQTLEQGLNAARLISLMAGVPATSGACTVNRLCGSSLQALNQAAHAIMAGFEDVQIVGGFEHMHHVPMDYHLDVNPKLFRVTSPGALHMGVTAEFLAQTQGISRLEQDEFAHRSHARATAAQDAGAFANEIVPVRGHDESSQSQWITLDQCVRRDSTVEALSALEPAFVPKIGSVTAGNSSPINDGASALLVMSEDRAKALGLKPMATIRGTAVAGVDPAVMGTGPAPAVTKLLKNAKMSLSDIDLIEINEAFAAQTLACVRMLHVDQDKLNVRGGALAIGHPLGASGARISTTLIHTMRSKQAQWGIATMCIGVGQGIATLFEIAA